MCICCVLDACLCATSTSVSVEADRKSDPREVDLQAVVNHHVGAGKLDISLAPKNAHHICSVLNAS